MNEEIIFSTEEYNCCKNKKGSSNQIAFGIMLAYFKYNIKFPLINDTSLPSMLVSAVAETWI